VSRNETSQLAETLRQAARAGQVLDLAPGVADADLNPPGGATWPPERQVPAAVLREVLLDADLKPDPRGLHVRGTFVTGTLDLDHATLPCPLALTRSHFERPATLRSATLPHLDLGGSHLPGLDLDGAHVDGSVLLRGLTATGQVRAIGAHIGGELVVQDATLTSKGRRALKLNRARVDGTAVLSGLTATGEVRAPGAHIGGGLDLQGATLTSKEKIALTLDGARVNGSALLSRLTATGEVRAPGAHIGGQLHLRGAKLTNADGDALMAEGLTAGQLLLCGTERWKGALNLTSARIGDLVVDAKRPDGGLPGPLKASGWTIADLHGVLRTDRRAANAWLPRQRPFVPQPWHAIADVYERNGQPADARILRFKAAHGTTRTSPWFSRAPRWAYGLLVGYGYYPLLAGIWLVAALATGVFLTSNRAAMFVPSDPVAVAQATVKPAASEAAGAVTGATSCARLRNRYPCFRPVLYSLEVVLPPTVASGQTSAWRPGDAALSYLLTALKTFGWLLTALLLAGVTGLLRKT